MPKKIFGDMTLNLIATAIPIVALQFIFLPILSDQMDGETYGLVITLITIFNVIPASFGNVLNNIRLLYENEYRKNQYTGDFQIILLVMCLINFVIVIILTIYYEKSVNIISLLLMSGTSFLWLLKEYYIVAFRIEINYKCIVINNLFMVIGYVFGYFIYYITEYWQFIYLVGYGVSLIYIMHYCNLWKEKFSITPFFKFTSIQTILLSISVLFSRVITYADKMLLYPMLGGVAVSIYFVATLFGKIISIAITPINSVVLTYLAKKEKKNDNIFKRTLLIGSGICIIGYILCLILSRPVLGFLYPQYIKDAMSYIFITTATSILGALIGLVNPFIMKYFDMKWQIIVNGSISAIYIVICMVLFHFFGLLGFCIGALFTNILKFVFMLIIYFR